jgi:replicative DNA helicase
MNLMITLGVLSSAVQGHLVVRLSRTRTEHTSLYVCAVAYPGERKTSAFDAAVQPVREWERETIEAGKLKLAADKLEREAAEELHKRLKKDHFASWGPEDAKRAPQATELLNLSMKLNQPPPIEFRYLAEDCTPAMLIALLADHGRLAFLTSEGDTVFGVLSGRFAKDGQADVSAWLKAYDGQSVRVDRKGGPAIIPRTEAANLCAVVTTQPSVFQDAIRNPAFLGQGFVHRFCWYTAPLSGPRWAEGEVPELVPEQVQAAYGKNLKRMLGVRAGTVATFSPEAAAEAKRWLDELERRTRGPDADLKDIISWASKHEGRTARIAGILWAADGADGHITGEQYRRAMTIARWLLSCTTAALRTSPVRIGEELDDRIVRLVSEGVRKRGALLAKVTQAQRPLFAPTLAKLIDEGRLVATKEGFAEPAAA